jgi:hypothetical protein
VPERECETWLAGICSWAVWPEEDCALLEVDDETMLLVETLDIVDEDVVLLVDTIGTIASVVEVFEVVDGVLLLDATVDTVASVVVFPVGRTTPT